jgi:hypothetical protein
VFYTQSQGVIHKVNFTGVPDVLKSDHYINNGTTPLVHIDTKWNKNGYMEIASVQAKVTQTFMKNVTRKVLVEEKAIEVEDNLETGEKTQETSDSTDASESTEAKSDSDSSDSNSNSTDSNSTESIPVKEAPKPKYTYITELVPKNKTHSKKMEYVEEYIGHQPMSIEMKLNATAHLVDFENRDKMIFDTMQSKNDYEALIYSTRDWISDDANIVYTTSEQIEKLREDLVENEDWLYEDGYDEKYEVYQERINELNKTIGPMRYRQSEHDLRDSILDHTKQFVKNMTDEIERLHILRPWIEEYKIERLKNMTYNATAWFEEKLVEQQQLALNEDPVLTSEDIRENILKIGYIMEKLSKTPKPRDWDKNIKEAQEAEAAKLSNSTLTNSTDDNSTVTLNTEDDANAGEKTEGQSADDQKDEDVIIEDL